MAILLFLSGEEKGKLGNISTGEGKTLIVSMLAVIMCLCGKKVDIVTSSKILAIRDSREYDEASREGCASFY
jgi:preprotein translocase subunit SecA